METFSVDQDLSFCIFNVNTHFPETGNGGEAVGTFQKICDPGSAFCKRAEHDSSVRNGFISGNGKRAG